MIRPHFNPHTLFFKRLLVAFFAQLLLIGIAFSQSNGTAPEAKALAEKAVAYIKSAGPEKAFDEFTAKDGKWQDRDQECK